MMSSRVAGQKPLSNTTQAPASSYSIVRVDTVNARGIPVHLWTTSIKRQSLDIQRHFYDGVYGDKQAALLMAEAYRDAALRLFPPRTQRQQSVKLRSTNTSGMAGVKAVRKNGRLVAWLAFLGIGKQKPLRRYFSIKDHGEARAKELAVIARQEMLQEYPDSFATVHPHATENANQHFPHLVDSRTYAPADFVPSVDARELERRLEMLNAWFDALKPRHVHVRISTYPVLRRGHDAILAIISNGGPPSQLKRKSWSLLHSSWQERIDEVWTYVQTSLTELLGSRYWHEFQSSHREAFFSGNPETGFFVRERLEDPAHEYLRHSPPDALRPMLDGFAVPALPPLHKFSSLK